MREAEKLSWKQWAKRLDAYFQYLEALFSPDLIIVGGGVSKKSEKFLPLISTRVDIVPAQLLNEAGIVGAAVAAGEATRRLAERGTAGEAGVGPVPPLDGVLAREPTQQVLATRRRLRGKVDQAAFGIAQHDAVALELLDQRSRARYRPRRAALPVRRRRVTVPARAAPRRDA